MRTVAVTGATGFIGRRLTAHLLESGLDVRAVGRPLDVPKLVDAFSGVGAVVHLAGVVAAVRERDYADVNVAGTRAVAEAAWASRAHLVHVSSLAAVGQGSIASPRHEESEPQPLTAYGCSKLESERVVASLPGLRWTILRPSPVYGPGDRALLPIFRMAHRGFIAAVGRVDAAYTFVHVDDVARAIAAALAAGPTYERIFVGHPEPVLVSDLLAGIQGAVGRSARIVRIPDVVTRVAALGGELAGRLIGRPMALNWSRYRELCADGFVCRVDRLRERLGVVAEVDLKHGLKETAAWYRARGWLAVPSA